MNFSRYLDRIEEYKHVSYLRHSRPIITCAKHKLKWSPLDDSRHLSRQTRPGRHGRGYQSLN
jgi:hypothetical protein